MAEVLANGFVSALAAPCGAGDTAVTLADVPPAPLSPLAAGDRWRLRVDGEIMLVTAAGGAVLTVTRAAEPYAGVRQAAAHPAGAGAFGVVTAESLRALSRDTYVHAQAVPSSAWTVAHHLGRYPSVTVVDSAGTVVVGDVSYADDTTLVVTFSAPFSGSAFLN